MKRIIYVLIGLFCTISLHAQSPEKDVMYAHYIDIGQGASTLLEFSCGAVLLDAGAQDAAHAQKLTRYLDAFFERRTDLNYTLNLVLVTHNHLDHNLVLDSIAMKYYVLNYIDNGLRSGSGKTNQCWLQDECPEAGIRYGSYSYEKITKNQNRKGLTNDTIDPVKCTGTDPKIILLSGAFTKKPAGWSDADFKNGNNQSIVVKVVFGEASFLFTGDLELDGINQLVACYKGTSMLDVDVIEVGHHGSDNAITQPYLQATTPEMAVISCGKWNYGLGKGDNKLFNTYKYGHPRKVTIDLLNAAIPGNRPKPVNNAHIFIKSAEVTETTISKNIYSTSWDNTISIKASKTGMFEVVTNAPER
jgi:competence protein ComEC